MHQNNGSPDESVGDEASKENGNGVNRFLGFAQKLSNSERITALLALGSLIVGAGSLCIAFLAWLTASDTRDIKKAVSDLAMLAQQSARQANALGNEVDSVNNEVSAIGNEASATANLVGPARDSADAALAGLRQEAQHFEIDERPIIDNSSSLPSFVMQIPQWVPSDRRFYWNYSIKNFGKTTAYNVVMHTYMTTFGRPFTCVGCEKRVDHIVPSDSVWGTAVDDRPNILPGSPSISFFNMAVLINISYMDSSMRRYYSDICLAQSETGSTQICDARTAQNIAFDARAASVRRGEHPHTQR